MDRRTFVSSGLCAVAGGLAGCLGTDEDSGPEDGPSAPGDYRDVEIEAENFTRRADNRHVENGQVSVILKIKNIGTEPEYADVFLQMRDREGTDLGSTYTRQYGPVAPGEIAELRFDVEEDDDQIGGYRLVVRSGEQPDDSGDGTDNSSAE